mmetsp:Transcript_56002/g.177451  ORF Transcript_56002/g.177451 Transcript_56002/m.177451 type:complete len:212 (-) Transcript_56002:262-897(-)
MPGWTEALQLMVPGEKRRFWIPSQLAYGNAPPPAPQGDLVFDIELLSFERAKLKPKMGGFSFALSNDNSSMSKTKSPWGAGGGALPYASWEGIQNRLFSPGTISWSASVQPGITALDRATGRSYITGPGPQYSPRSCTAPPPRSCRTAPRRSASSPCSARPRRPEALASRPRHPPPAEPCWPDRSELPLRPPGAGRFPRPGLRWRATPGAS